MWVQIDNINKIDSGKSKKIVAIIFYRLTDTIDINQKLIINSFSYIRFNNNYL